MQNTKPWVVKEKQAVSVPPTTAARRKRIEIRRFKMMSRPLRLLSDLTSGTKNCTCTKRARIDHNAAVLSSDDLMADASLSYSLNADELDLSGCSRIEEESRVSIEFPCVHEVCTSDRNARTEPSAAEDTSDTIPTSSLETVTSLVSTEAVSVISKGCNAPLDTDERGDMQTAISIDKPRDLALRSTSDSLSSRFSDNGMSITVDRSAVDTEADAVDMAAEAVRLAVNFLSVGEDVRWRIQHPSYLFFTQSQQNSGGPCFCIGKGDGRAPCDVHFFAVYDGHGGAQASTFCMERMHCALAEELSSLFHDHGRSKENLEQSSSSSAWKKAMTACFAKVDREVGGVCPHGDCHDISKTTVCCEGSIAPENVGTTAVVAVVSASQIVVANCGDSRAILSRNGKVIVLSEDHKPERVDECSRIEAAGGKVIYWDGYRVGGILALSRSIGDRYLKQYVISEPDVTCLQRAEEDEFLILASDGLWDVVSNENACEIARSCLGSSRKKHGFQVSARGEEDPSSAAVAALLVKLAYGRGSRDNISVVVVDLGS